jgi:hypothetical protein
MTFNTQPVQQFAEYDPVPIPYKGINAIVPLSQMDPQECIYAYNVIANQEGMQVRPGYAEWCKNLAGGQVRTIIAVRANGTGNDKLFGVTSQGIYDCTTSTSAPTKVVSFGITSGNAGWGSYEHCTNIGGDQTVAYCDETNGYYSYDCNTTTWTKVTMGGGGSQISGVDPTTFTFVRLFQNRLWFVQGGTGNSWFLGLNAVYGAATQFSYGNKFSHGGNLNSLWQFTYGSYFGTYIYLVGIGDSGDIVAYTGADPTNAATWTMSGQWYVGDMVPGRRVATNYGGDLTILSSYGAINLSALFYQKELADPNSYLTKKIAPAIKSEVALNQTRGWEIVSWPSSNSFLILDPNYANTYQFCYCLTTNAWTVFRGPPMVTAVVWHGQLYSGTPDGRIVVYTGGQDNVPIAGGTGVAIQWGVLGAFSNLRSPGTLKFVDLLRPYFLTDAVVPYNIFVRFDFNIADLVLGSGVPAPPVSLANAWDSGIWDSSIWFSSSIQPQVAITGQAGAGRWLAVGLLGASLGNTVLIAYEGSVRKTRSIL